MTSVLVVDDDPGQREMLRLLLEDAGYHVVEAGTGEGGLALLRAATERMIVLLDQRMPGLVGDEVLKIVAADPELATRHAYILLTASPHRIPMGPVLAHGSRVPVIEKPFNVEVLLAILAETASRLAPE